MTNLLSDLPDREKPEVAENMLPYSPLDMLQSIYGV
jgi:hypothetical protein